MQIPNQNLCIMIGVKVMALRKQQAVAAFNQPRFMARSAQAKAPQDLLVLYGGINRSLLLCLLLC